MGIWDNFYEKAKSFFTGEDEEGTSDNAEKAKTRCYYDLLEVDRDATEDEIKKSFKKLALKWHPDKNRGKEEQCAAYFILIQQAYEVLSDPQERAFYDRHRENIIYQNTDGPDQQKDTGTIIDPYMNTSCWRAGIFDEEERLQQFYNVYRDLFHKLAAEEYAYIDDPEERNYPVFGTFTSDYETVVAPFYAFWLNFTTRRSFAWLDKWNLREAPDRPSARYMEKENKKSREHGRKLRSEQIRKLVEFVRKHDKRVELARQKQAERNAAIKKKVEEQRRQTILRNLEKLETFECDEQAHKEHLMDLEQIEAALDAQFGTVTSTAGGDSDDHGSELDDEANEEFQCILCEKSFKSRNMLEHHQRSKKHRQTMELMKNHMREEDRQLFEEEEAAEASAQHQQADEKEQKDGGRGGQQRKKKKKQSKTESGKNDEEENQIPSDENQQQCQTMEEGRKEKQQQEEEENDNNKTNKIDSKNKKKSNRRKGGGTIAEAKNNKREHTGPVPSQCTTCSAEFESKSKLHAHLKETGHAALKTVTTTNAKGTMGDDLHPKRGTANKGKRRDKHEE